jgi:uncharacterized membrane protein YkvA (DUF1232 family)
MRGRFLSTLKTTGNMLRQELAVYRLVRKDPRTPLLARVTLALAIGYVLLPFDLIPDFLPVVGQFDDLIIVPALIVLALKFIPTAVIEDCRRKASQSSNEGNGVPTES